MNLIKFVVATALLTIATFALVLYSSCKKDPCKGVNCLNGGACNKGVCVCTNGYTGTYCETVPDLCAGVVCQNGGVCNLGKCKCPSGYEGTFCEKKMSRDKFIGTYTGTEICSTGNDAYSLTLTAHTDAMKLTMTNIYNNTPPYVATCTVVSTDSFTFIGSQGFISYSGTGWLSGNTLTVDYTITDGSVSNTCTFTGNR